jgi:hypothetical protein
MPEGGLLPSANHQTSRLAMSYRAFGTSTSSIPIPARLKNSSQTGVALTRIDSDTMLHNWHSMNYLLDGFMPHNVTGVQGCA